MKTILVVDDSPICREPIAATLRLNGYQTLEAANGQEALHLASRQLPDLILPDVTMPVMDGLTCVGHLRSSPATAKIPVIMLTASSERTVILQAAHKGIAGFLLKSNFSTADLMTRVQTLIGSPKKIASKPPSPPEVPPNQESELSSPPVTPSAGSRESPHRLTKAMVLQRVTKANELRSVKPALEYVIALTRSEASTLEDIASALREDQALALRVLSVANSSYYQRGRSAKNLMEATQRIGLKNIRNTVIAILAIEHFEQVTESGLVPQHFWEHSLATAVLAETIGEAISNPKTDQLFLAGLLHDVGRMVLSSAFPKEYAAVLSDAAEQDLDLEVVEKSVFELSHADTTRLLLKKWNMPELVIEAAGGHESSIETLRQSNQHAQGCVAVAMANRLAHALLLGNSGNARLLPYQGFASELGIGREAVDKIVRGALEKTADTEMFYEARSGKRFSDRYSTGLAKRAGQAPRIAVVGPDSPADPFSLFLGQLGWLEPDRPSAVVAFVRSNKGFGPCVSSLKKFDAAVKKPVPVIVATTGGAVPPPPPELKDDRPTQAISLPCGYSRLVDAVMTAIDK